MTINHTTESVERLAQSLEGDEFFRLPCVVSEEAPTTLRDLAAERDALRARLDEAVKAERERCKEAIRQSAKNMQYNATKRDGSPKLRFDIMEVRAAVRDVSEYYASALDRYGAAQEDKS